MQAIAIARWQSLMKNARFFRVAANRTPQVRG